MKIKKYTKLKNNQYKILLDNDLEIKLYDDVILKENLLLTKEITKEKLNKLVALNDYYVAYYKALKMINIKLRSEKEIVTSLKKDFNNKVIDSVIKDLRKEGYINNKTYINSYIHDALVLTLKGPFKIKSELIGKGFKEEEINEILSEQDNIWEERISKYLDKRLKLSSSYSNQKLKQKIVNDLMNLGYSKEMILEKVSAINLPSDYGNLEKDYNKLKVKLERKGVNDIEYTIVNKLMQKGYRYEDIKNVIK